MDNNELLPEQKFKLNTSETSGYSFNVFKIVFICFLLLVFSKEAAVYLIWIIIPVAGFYFYSSDRDHIVLNSEGVFVNSFWNGKQFIEWSQIKRIECYTDFGDKPSVGTGNIYFRTLNPFKTTTSKVLKKVICISTAKKIDTDNLSSVLPHREQVVIPHSPGVYKALIDYRSAWKKSGNKIQV
ncbi:MAG TPA: hypothetical protein VEC12_13770 [Bacteroidia bacterium]|nr:hypothetical protein [Bacteroidia bacterium]